MLTRLFKILLAIFIITNVAQATTFGTFKGWVRESHKAIDTINHVDSIVRHFADQEQVNMCILGEFLEAETTYVLSTVGKLNWRLPSNFHRLRSVYINPLNTDPNVVKGPEKLKYVPMEDFEYGYTNLDGSRPTRCSAYHDSLRLDYGSQSGDDTLKMYYVAKPPAIIADSSTLRIPSQYEPLLLKYVVLRCLERVQLKPVSEQKQDAVINLLEQKLYGRPPDN